MEKGIKQGCPASALIVILVFIMLAMIIRKCENVKGIKMGENEYKIIQYAHNATILSMIVCYMNMGHETSRDAFNLATGHCVRCEICTHYTKVMY